MQQQRAQKKAAKQQQIIDVAERLLESKGAYGLNARNIAKAMGCAVGSLYRCFDSLDDIIAAVNMRTLIGLEKHVLQATEDAEFATEYLQDMAFAYMDYVMKYPKLWQAVMEFHFTEIPEDYMQQQDRLFRLLEIQLQALMPHAKAQEISLEARALWVGMDGLCALMMHGRIDKHETLGADAIAHVLLQRFISRFDSKVKAVKGGENVS